MKKIFWIFSVLFLLISACCGFLFTETGRNFLISKATKYFFQDRVKISVRGIDPAVKNIDFVSVEINGGAAVKIEKIKIDRKGFFGIPYFHVNDIKLTYASAPETEIIEKTAKNIPDEKSQKAKIISAVKMIPLFTSGFEIKNFSADVNGKKYNFNDVKYSAEKQKISLRSDVYGDLSAQINFGVLKPASVRIDFAKCCGADGTLVVDNVFSPKQKKFHLTGQHKFCNVDAYGNFVDPAKKIELKKCCVTKENDRIDLSGTLYPEMKKISLAVPVNFKNIPTAANAIPEKFSDAVRGYLDGATLHADSVLLEDFATDVRIEKDGKRLAAAKGSFQNGHADVSADLFDIDVLGYKLSHADGIISEKRIAANLIGNDFRIETLLEREQKHFKLSKFDIFSKFGNVMLKLPVVLSSDILKKNCFKIGFDIRDFRFFENFAPGISGAGTGEIEYSGPLNKFDRRNMKFKISSPAVSYKNFSGSRITAEGDGKSYEFSAGMIKLPHAVLKKISAGLHQNSFKIHTVMNEENDVTASGKISDDFQKITIGSAAVKIGKQAVTIRNSSLNFANASYLINGGFSGHKRPGSFQIDLTPARCKLSFSDIHLADFNGISGQHLRGTASGNIALNNAGGIFQGSGKISLVNVPASRNTTDISLNFQRNGIVVNMGLNKRGNVVRCDVSLPFVLRNTLQLSEINGRLNARIYGKNKLENFFELPDKSDLRGDFDCDCTISGSLKNPKISGYLNIKNTLICIGSVLLANGDLQLVGDGENLRVVSAKFIDNKKNTASAAGCARLFFDGFSPNLDVNLDLDFRKFFILSSDSLKVQVTGKGKMSGPVNNMKLVGDLQVPYAKISNFETQDDPAAAKLEFVNDPLLSSEQKKNQTEENSFFTYDIGLHCKRVKVAGKMFKLFLKGDLSLSMFGKQDTLVGSLKLIDGKLNIFGKRMKFVKGDVTFLREQPYNPKAYFVCRKNFGNMLVTLEVFNSPKKGASIKLSSNPNYSLDVILAQMLFNKDSKSLSAGEAAQLVQAVSSLQEGQGYLLSMLSTLTSTGLWDNISFSSGDGKYSSSLNKNSQTTAQQVNVSAGKYLRDNVYVSINKKDDQTTFDIDVSLTPTVSVKANTAGEVGLSWKYRY